MMYCHSNCFGSVRHKIKTRFSVNLLLTWFEFENINSENIYQFMDQNLFNNPPIVIDINKSFFPVFFNLTWIRVVRLV